MINKIVGWFLVVCGGLGLFGVDSVLFLSMAPEEFDAAPEWADNLYFVGTLILGFMFVLTEEIKDAFRGI